MEGEIITIETAQKLAEYDKLKKLVKNQKDVIDKAIEYINDNLIISSNLDDKKTYCLNNYTKQLRVNFENFRIDYTCFN